MRNHVDIGRGAALMLAAVLVVAVPLRSVYVSRAYRTADELQRAADVFTGTVGQKGVITLEDYEELLATVHKIGRRAEVTLSISRQAEPAELYVADAVVEGIKPAVCAQTAGTEETSGKSSGDLITPPTGGAETDCEVTVGRALGAYCGAHVHTQACYAGHNHEVSLCEYHEHSADCYCSGRMTSCYHTEKYSTECFMCDGTGDEQTKQTCSNCEGVGIVYFSSKCNGCSGTGREWYWVLCPECGGEDPDCSCCEGYGALDKRRTCTVCGGSGLYEGSFTCGICKGTGEETITSDCTYCGGDGILDYYTSYYECSVCHQGSTTSYGTSCTRMNCGYEQEGYQCGNETEDTTPLCGEIIVDAEYSAYQPVYTGDSPETLDTCISVTYLNGNTSVISAKWRDSGQINMSKCGTMTAELELTGYFMNAQTYETRYFPVVINVQARTAQCSRCGKIYFLNEDGSDPGCPYCYTGPVGIRTELLQSVYEVGEELKVSVYLCYEDHEEAVDPDECWDTFDSDYAGRQTVMVGYLEYVAEVTVTVNEPEEGEETGGGSSSTGSGSDSGSESGGSSESGSGSGSGGSSGSGSGTGSESGSGTGTEYDNSGYADGRGETERYTAVPSNLITNDEITQALYNLGYCELEAGDAVSVTITPQATGIFSLTDGLIMKNREITSGAVI